MIAGAAKSAITGGPLPLSPRVVIDAWRRITGAQVRVTLLVGAAYFLYQAISWFGGENHGLGPAPEAWLLLFPVRLATVFALLLCVVVADCVTGVDAKRKAPYAWAVIVGSAAGTTILAVAVALRGLETLGPGVWAYLFLETVMLAGAAVFVYTSRRAAQAALARMQGAELERVRTSQRTLASRLQAMQARVEPQFLFDTLARVKRLYERDPPLADRVLDELIAYLRAAMPRMRDVSSTVAQEVALVQAFLNILSADLGPRLDLVIAVPDDAAEARLPPMLLLPLVNHIAGRSRAERTAATVRIAIAVNGERLRVTVAHDRASCDPVADDALEDLRERLAALYGGSARLERWSAADHAAEVTIEIPYERAPRDADGSPDPPRARIGAVSEPLRAANR